MTGVDPLGRAEIAETIRSLGQAGKTVLLSSHVLHEIEAITEEILVIYHGQVLAEGNMYEIRKLIDGHPHRIRIECERPRELAPLVAGANHVSSIAYERSALVVETSHPDTCYDQLAALCLENDIVIRSLTSSDNSLAAVFDYLTGAKR